MKQPIRWSDWVDPQPRPTSLSTSPPVPSWPTPADPDTPAGQVAVPNASNSPIAVLDLSVRAYNALKRSGIHTIGKLAALSRDDLKGIRNIGPTTIAEIETRLAAYQGQVPGIEPLTNTPPRPPANDPLLHAVSVARLGLPSDLTVQLGAAGLQMLGQVVDVVGRNSYPPAVGQAVADYLTWWAEQPPAARVAEVTATGPSPLARPELREEVTLAAAIDDWLSQLDDRPRQVVRLRFGLDGPALTLEELGQRLGVTRERVRQIEKKALKVLRQKHRARVTRSVLAFAALLRHELVIHERGWPLDACVAWLRSNEEICLGPVEPVGLLNLLCAVDQQLVLWPKHNVIALAGVLPGTPPRYRSRPTQPTSASTDSSLDNALIVPQAANGATGPAGKGQEKLRPARRKPMIAPPQRLTDWPNLWLDRWRDHGSFMQFAAYANERLTSRPTVAKWTADLLVWAHRSPSRSADYRQCVLDAAYIVGLIGRVSYTKQLTQALEPCLPAQVSAVELRNHCIRSTLDRLDKAPALLREITQRASFTLETVQTAPALNEATAVAHLQLFRLLGLINGRGPIYTAAPLAASFLSQVTPSQGKTAASQPSSVPRVKETQRALLLRALETLGRPAHIGEIVHRAAELTRGPSAPKQSVAILILLQADERAVISLGEGVFSLTEWEVARAQESRPTLPICPRPWVDVRTFHDRLLESAVVAHERLRDEPTAAEFLAHMLAWWGVDMGARLWVRQSVMSAYYLLGVVPFTFAGDDQARLRSQLPPLALAETRDYCRRAVTERLTAMPTWLDTLRRLAPARPKELAEAFAPHHPYGLNDAAARLHFLVGLGVVERLPDGTYRLSGPSGTAALRPGGVADVLPDRLRTCPALLPDRPGEGHTFLESIVQADRVLGTGPTVEQFLREMITWAGSDYPKSETYYQNVLDAYYVVGLLERTRYAGHEGAILRSTLPPTADISVLRDHCIRAALDRLVHGRRLLDAAGQLQPFTRREMQGTLDMAKHDASYHIRLFVSLGALTQEGTTLNLSPFAARYCNYDAAQYAPQPKPDLIREPRQSWPSEDGLEALAYLIDH